MIRYTQNMARTITKDIKALFRTFGFHSEGEFIARAVQEKVKQLKALLVSRTAEKVRRGLASVGITSEEMLDDFERSRRS